jgi:hypothetical protein
MQSDVKQSFYFHADANSIGGFLEKPFRHIPTPCSVSLPSAGGNTSASAKDFGFEEGIKARAAYTHVTGKHAQRNGPWTHRVVSVVEGLSILGRFTAERMVSQMFVEQPEAGAGPRKVSFAGSRFDNVQLDGKPLKIILNDTLLPEQHREIDAYNQDAFVNPDMEWPALSSHAKHQSEIHFKSKSIPSWAQDRFGWIDPAPVSGETGFKGYTLCSLVDRIDGLETGQTFGHCIELPDFGRIFLGEVMVLPYSAHLTMLRAELGCAVTGQVSASVVGSNGTMCPPN